MDQETLELVAGLHGMFTGKGWSLSAAESCTGGLLSHYITAQAGASLFFRGAAVTYSIESKKRVLGVNPAILDEYGAVSAETAMEMAWRACEVFNTDFAVSTTGNLGPDVLEGKPRGLVYIGVSAMGDVFFRRVELSGGRLENKRQAAVLALKFLIERAGLL
ncbi:MAG: CinA family protein [Nitrospiraceae bacterium]|nr:CinA family protein [Nitrospiraceae bacterium]